MIENSSNLKISIYTDFGDPDNEEISEVAILLMKGKNVIRGRIFGNKIDETDDNLAEKIITEETDVNMVDPETFKLGIRNVETSSHEYMIQIIYDYMESLKSVIKRIDGSEDGEDQYVIYNDNKKTMMNSNFFHELGDYIQEHDEDLLPTSLKDIYNRTTDIKQIFANYGYTDIMYIEGSAISNAAFIGVALDFSLGYK